MTCGVGDVRLRFLESELEIRPYELSTRSPSRDYSHAQAKVSHRAALLIADRALDNEPVEVVIAGEVQNRYLYPADTLEINRNDGFLKLYDARKILEGGAMTGYYDEVLFREIMPEIFSRRKDPYGVLTGWIATSPEIINAEIQDAGEDVYEAVRGTGFSPQREIWSRPIISIFGTLRNKLSVLDNETDKNHFVGLDLDDVSPAQALQKLEATFGITSWVDTDGVLWVGHREGDFETHAVTGHQKDAAYSMIDYNITRSHSPVTLVRVNGKTKFYNGDVENMPDWYKVELFPLAEAWVVGDGGSVEDGRTLVVEDPLDVWELETLEAAARNKLLQANSEYRTGSIKLNGSASGEKARLATMKPGDVIVVSDFVTECHENLEGGAFTIEEVQHQLRPRNGWRTTIEVSILPLEMDSMAVYYDSTNDEAYNSLRSYAASNPEFDG